MGQQLDKMEILYDQNSNRCNIHDKVSPNAEYVRILDSTSMQCYKSTRIASHKSISDFGFISGMGFFSLYLRFPVKFI